MDYADALMRLNLPVDAIEQYELALKFNDLLPEEEPKRRNDGDIRARYAAGLASVGRRDQAAEQARQAAGHWITTNSRQMIRAVKR